MKKLNKVLAFLLSLSLLASGQVQMVSAKENTSTRYVEVDGTEALVSDAEVHVYVTKNAGTVELTGINGVESTFTQGIGYREYTAKANEGWVWKGWNYEQLYQGNDLGNRYDYGLGKRYSFTNDGDNWHDPYNGTGATISVNRLLTVGETHFNKLIYNIYANLNPTITATAGEGGKITTAGTTEIEYGANAQYSIEANKGYKIAAIYVDGKAISFADDHSYSYEFSNVIEPHTISATFVDENYKETYDVTYSFENETNLPVEVNRLLPTAEKVEAGATANPTSPISTRVETKDGVWLFEGWTPEKVENVSQDVHFTGTWNFYQFQKVIATELTAYEGGLGTGESTETGNALPEPEWNSEMKNHKVTVGGVEWDVEANGLPFTWEYVDENNHVVDYSATVGTYYLKVYPKAELNGADVIVDDLYALVLPKDGIVVSTVNVRDITNDENANTLSSDTFKNVYNYQAPSSITANVLATSLFALDQDNALNGEFDTTTGTHTDECDLTEPHAHVQEGTIFYINGDETMPVSSNEKIGLLWDNLLSNVLGSEERMEALHNKSMAVVDQDTFDVNGTVSREFKYVDLVDMTNGNVWVGTKSKDVTIYYPYPKGVTKDTPIAATYYDGLTRDYTIDHSDLDSEIASSNAHPVKNLVKTETGILFDIPSKQFGPIEVMWQNNYTPTYEFVSGTEGKVLPNEVTDLLDEIQIQDYVEGEEISAPTLTTTEVKVTDGVWKFAGWDKETAVSQENVNFVGTWTFTATQEPTDPENPNDNGNNTTDQGQTDSENTNNNGNSTIINTGDNSTLHLWLAMFVMSGLAVVMFIINKKKKEY